MVLYNKRFRLQRFYRRLKYLRLYWIECPSVMLALSADWPKYDRFPAPALQPSFLS